MKDFKLDNRPKITPGFTVPEDYFESFSAQLMSQVRAEPKVFPLKTNKKTWFFAAAALLILALTIPAINEFQIADSPSEMAALENYIAYSGITDDQIVELLENEDIEKIKIDYSLDRAEIEDALYSGPSIENYLLN